METRTLTRNYSALNLTIHCLRRKPFRASVLSDTIADVQISKPRLLDDEELDSGDDEGREDRLPDDEDALALDDGQQAQEELTFMDVEFGRHPIPEPSDGEVWTTKSLLHVRTC